MTGRSNLAQQMCGANVGVQLHIRPVLDVRSVLIFIL
jgi:hypothetical protein